MKVIFRKQWLRKGSLHTNVLLGAEGIDHPLLLLIYCPHIFQAQNYSFLPPISAIQTRPAYSSARFDSSLNSASSFSIGYAPYSSINPMLSFDSNPIPLNSSSFHTESHVVQDLSVRVATQSVLPLQIDWYGPSRPSTSYMVSTQSNLMTSTSSNSQSGVQRFFQEFRLPDYTLDIFSRRLLDVVSSTTFSSGDIQVELHHAITRLMVFCICIF